MLVELILFVAVVLAVVTLVLYFINVNKTPYKGAQATYDLSVPNQLVLPRTAFAWTDAPCTIRFAIYVQYAPRTVAKVDCIEDTEPITSFAPNCGDYSFKSCMCTATNCSNCSLTNSASGYLTNLLSIGDYVQLWASGYTSQNDKPYVPALLKVRTGTDSSQHYMESIPLPAIPLQKWTAITIVKDGRRFDVYYGAKLQVSKLTDYVPIPPDSILQWMSMPSGSTDWKGQIGFFTGYTSAYYAPDVKKDMESLLNTRGIPFYIDQPPLSWSQWYSSGGSSSCLFGNCDTFPSVSPPPGSPFTVYSTNVS
jgi:hypothetical protein